MVIVAILIVGAGAIGVFVFGSGLKSGAESSVSRQGILALFQKSDWSAIAAASAKVLEGKPLDTFYLSMQGLASFYEAMGLPQGSDRDGLIDQAIASLRKALASGSEPGNLTRAQLEYILGKAYYQKDGSSLDLAGDYLRASLSHGYSAPDSHEYLAMIESALGDDAIAQAEFEKALAVDQSPLLKIAAASSFIKIGQGERAEGLLKDAIAATGDAVAREKARLLLSQEYFSKSHWTDCEAQLQALLAENPDSAEAHYQLGLLYQARGDSIQARAEWRKTVSIDPMHPGARQKLAERS